MEGIDYSDTQTNSLLHKGRTLKRRWRLLFAATLMGLLCLSLILSVVAVSKGCSKPTTTVGSVAVRLLPGDDLLSGVMAPVIKRGLKAAWMESTVGSLSQYAIRFANESDVTVGPVSHFEIVSLSGTMSSNGYDGRDGSWHLHIAVSNSNGTTIGGHLASGFNSTVYTTVEVVIGFNCQFEFRRAVDGSTPWDELQIIHESWC